MTKIKKKQRFGSISIRLINEFYHGIVLKQFVNLCVTPYPTFQLPILIYDYEILKKL